MTDRITQDYFLKSNWEVYQKSQRSEFIRSYTRYVYTQNRKTKKERAFYMTIVPAAEFVEKYNNRLRSITYLKRDKSFSGYILFHELDGNFTNGWEYKDGKITGKVLPAYMVFGKENTRPLLLGKYDISYQVKLKMEKMTRSGGDIEDSMKWW